EDRALRLDFIPDITDCLICDEMYCKSRVMELRSLSKPLTVAILVSYQRMSWSFMKVKASL
ncbi:MAG: hypothetical protein IJG51_11055, partial [Synergistaceae bacterium]|nr:hypothetical protein [Synergistaceae bacterium]